MSPKVILEELLESVQRRISLEGIDNSVLAKWLERQVLARFEQCSPEADLLRETIRRLNETSTGATFIAQERHRQIEKEGYTAEYDDQHTEGELALAAICYAAPRPIYVKEQRDRRQILFVDPWPWDGSQDKRPGLSADSRTLDKNIELMVKAGALLAAEIDRLLRLRLEEALRHGREVGTCRKCGGRTVLWHEGGQIYVKCTRVRWDELIGVDVECPYKEPIPEDLRMRLIAAPLLPNFS